MKDLLATFTLPLLILAVVVAGMVGWVLNIGAILYHFDAMSTGEAVIRIAGIFIAFIGAVMGYF